MNSAQKQLLMGAVKSAVSGASGMILSLNIVDPSDFSIKTLGGWEHLLSAIGITILVSEARFWKQWSESPADEPKVPATPATVITETSTTTIQPPTVPKP